MAVFKRPGSPKYYMKFMHGGKQVYLSCKTTDKALANKRERDERGRLEKLDQMPDDQKPLEPAPTLRAFAQLPDPTDAEMPLGGTWWVDEGTNRPDTAEATITFYRERLAAILRYAPLADAKLDEINLKLIGQFVRHRRATVTGSTVNRDLSVLRVLLDAACRWELIRGMPKFPKKTKEKRIGRALTREEYAIYLAAVGSDHRDFVQILASSGMEPGIAAELQWGDVHFEAVGKYTNGFLFDRCQKNEFRERQLGMTSTLAKVLKERWLLQGRPSSGAVFPSDYGLKGASRTLSSFQSTHKRLWIKTAEHTPIAIPRFRLYDFRHTALTWAVLSGASAFELKQMAGWSTIRMADNYIHLDNESRAKTADRLSAYMEAEEAKASSAATGKQRH